MILFAVVKNFSRAVVTDDIGFATKCMSDGATEFASRGEYATLALYVVDRFSDLESAQKWADANRGGIGYNDGDTLLSIYSVIDGKCCKQHGVSVL